MSKVEGWGRRYKLKVKGKWNFSCLNESNKKNFSSGFLNCKIFRLYESNKKNFPCGFLNCKIFRLYKSNKKNFSSGWKVEGK